MIPANLKNSLMHRAVRSLRDVKKIPLPSDLSDEFKKLPSVPGHDADPYAAEAFEIERDGAA